MLDRVSRRLAALLQTGAIKPHIGASFAFTGLPAALAALAGRSTTGKLVLTFTDGARA